MENGLTKKEETTSLSKKINEALIYLFSKLTIKEQEEYAYVWIQLGYKKEELPWLLNVNDPEKNISYTRVSCEIIVKGVNADRVQNAIK